MVEFWNEKYSGKKFHYGKEPNEFFKSYIDSINKKNLNILFPADGEGRNSVYAAIKGHNVYAFDQSDEAKRKAIILADENNVKINYEVSDVLDYKSSIKFDLIVMIYFHLPPEIRIKAHHKFINMLNVNGIILMEAFNKKQINNTSGGPKNIDMLYSKEELKSDFDKLQVNLLEEKTIHLDESSSHRGNADIIRMIAEK